MVEKNCSDATRNSGEMLGSRKERYPVQRVRRETGSFSHILPPHAPICFSCMDPALNPISPDVHNSLTFIFWGCFLQEAGQPLVQDNVLKVKRGNERPALELWGWEGSETKEGLGGR